MIGCHILKSGYDNYLSAFLDTKETILRETGVEIGAMQIFAMGPRNRNMSVTKPQAKKLSDYMVEHGIYALTHNAYATSAWNEPNFRLMRQQVISGFAGIIVHFPHEKIITPPRSLPEAAILEIAPAKPANAHYLTRESIEPFMRDGMGYCIDSGHAWASGIDVSSYDVTREWLHQFRGLERFCFHLNDNERSFAGGRDKTACFYSHESAIWKRRGHNDGLKAFCEFAREYRIPIILERKATEHVVRDLKILRELRYWA